MEMNALSSVIILITVVFLMLLTMRNITPQILQDTYHSIISNSIVSISVLLLLVGMAMYYDESETMMSVSGLIACVFLFLVMSHPSTFMETFVSNQTDSKQNVREHTMEILHDLYKGVESAENGMVSLPNQDKDIMDSMKQMKETITSHIKSLSSNKETFKSCNHPDIQKKMVKQKLDTIIETLYKEVDNSETDAEFCNNKVVCSFLKYVLETNPNAFFDPPIETKTDVTDVKETFEDDIERDLKQMQSFDVYRKRALALVNILNKRKEMNCNTLTLYIGCKGTYKGILPFTELDIKDREFTFDPLEAQEFLHNPDKFEETLSQEFAEDAVKEKQMSAIVRIMRLMTYLKDSKKAKTECPEQNTQIYVLV